MKFVHASGDRPLDGYVIKRGVGAGGFGEVYFAVSDAGKEVALKRIQRNLDIELRGVRQCLNLKHTNLIALYDIRYSDDDQAWVVMEYVNGESLKDVIDRNPNGMPLDQVNAWFKGLGQGTAYLHDHGIVHRDLKPGNVFSDDDAIKIGDYGLSKFISCSRRSGQTESVGTFHYMAPEIGKGIYGKEIDIYALGIVLFELLTGVVPFDGESSQEIIMKHLTADPDLSEVPEPYREVIRRALLKDPEKRIGSVHEMLDMLGLSEDGSASLSQPSPPVRAEVVDEKPVYIGDDHEEIMFGAMRDSMTGRRTSGVSTETSRTTAAAPVADEPIARAVKTGWRNSVNWWHNAKLSVPLKVAIVVGVASLLCLTSPAWLPVAVPVGIGFGAVYLVYFGIRSLMLILDEPRPETPPAGDTRFTSADEREYTARSGKRAKPSDWRKHVRRDLSRKPAADRLTDSTGSFLMSSLVCAVMTFLMMVVGPTSIDASVHTWTFYAWMTLTTTLAAWTILGIGKLWEASEGENIRRRFAMLIAGLVIGAISFIAWNGLMVSPQGGWVTYEYPAIEYFRSMYGTDKTPQLPAYLAYFAGMFALLRWWKLADPLRTTRLGIWKIGVHVFWIWILAEMCWPLHGGWGLMLPAVIAIAVQFSAPWMGPEELKRARARVWQA